MNKRYIKLILIIIIGFIFISSVLYAAEQKTKTTATSTKLTTTTVKKDDTAVLDLNNQIKNKKNKISDLKRQIDVYKNNIEKKQQEASTLANEIAILENQISQTELDIELVGDEVEQSNLEIQQAQLSIKDTEDSIDAQKIKLSEFIRQAYTDDQVSYLEILLENNSFSEFFEQVKYLELTQNELNKTLSKIKMLREDLGVQKATIENNKKRLEELQGQMESQKQALIEQKQAKTALVDQTKLSEEKFQSLLEQARAEQSQIDTDLTSLEKNLREKLSLLSQKNTNSKASMVWPVSASRGITSYFHDKSYPFRYVFEHPAIDVRAYQSTPVRAAESGYVARAKNAGMGYSYVMILHNDDLATVYGHLSSINVSEDSYVKKGQIIGLSGGTPGTPGAGNMTTGPHLHFEVRLNGIPVNPLNYLP